MYRPHPYLLGAAVAAIAVGFTICAAAAERVEHVPTQTEFSPPAAGPSSGIDIEAALARVNAGGSRARRCADGFGRRFCGRKSVRNCQSRLRGGAADWQGKRIVGARELNREGEHALKRALRIVEADPDASKQTQIETLIQMGDWYQIKKSPREALPYYQRAWQLIHAAPSVSGSVATALNVPVRVYYPTPEIVAHVPAVPPEETRSHYVQIEFTVAADGRAVATPAITYREAFWTAKPRT